MFGDGKPDDRLPELLGESSEAASYTRIRLILAFWPLKVAELVEAEIEAVRHGSKIRFKRQESPTITSNARKHQHTRFENGKLLRAELKKIFEGFECVKKWRVVHIHTAMAHCAGSRLFSPTARVKTTNAALE